MTERLFILDAHSLIYQVFHALPEMTSPSGLPTNAVYGFVRDIEILRKQKRPDYLVCAFDAPGPTFRHEIYAEYKGHRPPMPDDLRPQIDLICRVLEAYRIPVLSEPGIEADDFLASVAVAAANRKIQAFLCTADKDARQLVGDYVSILDLRRNRIIDRQYIIDDWGITPEQVIDYQAMIGDSTDNIPGISGVGPKTATALLQKYGTLEEICAHADEITKPKMRERISQCREATLLSRSLVRLKTDVPLPEDWSAWRLHDPDWDRLLGMLSEFGFHRVVDELRAERGPVASDWQADYRLVATDADLDRLVAEASQQPQISIDLLTNDSRAMWAEIVGVGISWNPGEAFYVALRAPAGQTELSPTAALEKLRPVLENPEIEKVGQDLKQTLVVLRRAGVEMQGVAFDSMVASYLFEPGERIHSLGELSERFLSHRMTKLESLIGNSKSGLPATVEHGEVEKVAGYGAECADVAMRLTRAFAPKLQEDGLDQLFDTVEMPLVSTLADMEFCGVKVDGEHLRRLGAEFEAKMSEIALAAYEAAGKEFNLDSPTQLRKLLFEELRLPVIKRTKTGPSTDQEVLEELSDRHPVCSCLLEHRALSKLKGTYVDALPALVNPATGRIHASFNQTVAATGRLSSSDPNLQNIPIRTAHGQEIRRAFIPGEPGQLLLSADYSQIELRLLAHYAQDEVLKRAFAEDMDIHAVVAAEIAGVAQEDVTSEMRRQAKAVNFGIMYGQSPYGLARQLKIAESAAATFINAYFARYPGIDRFMTGVLEFARKHRYVATILGRRRPITGVKNTTGRSRNLSERTAINTVIQGSAADLIKKAMVAIHRRLQSEQLRASMLLQIHDELLFEVEAEDIEPLARLVDEEMTSALQLDGVPLKVDIGIGPNWLELSSLELAAA